MKNLFAITFVWLLAGTGAFAAVPKAMLSATPIQVGQWPVKYELSINIPKDHHAYLDKGLENIYIPIQIDPKQKLVGSGLSIKQSQAPAGVFDNEVKATVLRGQGDFSIELAKQGTQPVPTAIDVDVNYQLCSDVSHVCYRPQTSQVNLSLPAMAKPVDAQTKASSSFTDQLLDLFKNNQDNLLVMFGLMLLAGLLSVATPCVYPMLPITSMFIVNRANGVARQEKLHALAYLLGIIGTYMVLGLIAGMTGGAFNTFMQSAWVNLGFAVFFAFFAIALLGFYELSFMQTEVHSLDQHSARVQGLAGTWLMGMVAGLVISPCVGPIVFALLLQVANNIAEQCNLCTDPYLELSIWHRLKISSQGSIMMAGFGLGVGLPFFLVSVLKFKKLPKAGYWMNKIKYGFGLIILYFAYVYFQKGMGVLGVDPNTSLTLALGMVAVWIAVVYCNVLTLLPEQAQPNQKMLRYVGVLSIILGIWLVIAGLSHTPIMLDVATDCTTSQVQQAAAAPLIESEAGITWYRNFPAAQKAAQASGKPIFIDFYASWCANCLAFKEEAANNKQLNQALREHAIALKLIDQEPEFEQFRQNPEHRQLKIGLPYFAILSADGKLLWSSTDYQATAQMVSVLNQHKS